MENFSRSRTLTTFLVLLLPAMAQAHPGHGPIGWETGLSHPLQGMDHLLAMIAVGLWAAQLGGRALWAVPASFVAAMVMGGALGAANISMPMIESGVMTSVLVLGILITFAVRIPVIASATLVGMFALYHGCAHGLEKAAEVSGISYAVGFSTTTLLLQASGIAMGLFLKRQARSSWTQAIGAGIAVVGATAFLQ
jgi:urease accessory protein